MQILVKIGAVLLLLAGAIYPLVAILALMQRLNRKPGPLPAPAQVMVRILLIATVPLAALLAGLAGLNQAVWQSNVLRGVIFVAAAASIVGFVALAVLIRSDRAVTDNQSPVNREQ